MRAEQKQELSGGGIMATFIGTSGNDTANAVTGELTGFQFGDIAELTEVVRVTMC